MVTTGYGGGLVQTAIKQEKGFIQLILAEFIAQFAWTQHDAKR